MHRRALLALAGSSLAFLALGFTSSRADEYRVSGPIVHENLAIYLVHGKSAAGRRAAHPRRGAARSEP